MESGVENVMGVSSVIWSVEDDLECVATSDASVLISGERGVGKGSLARYIHQASQRRSGPFVALNCAKVPDAILASELFGPTYEGQTTSYAARLKSGRLDQAHGGTMFLDEIGATSPAFQALLLRFLESRESPWVRPLSPRLPIDVRVITATSESLAGLDGLVMAGTFSAQLFYLLNIIHIRIPPLRERREDIPVLLDHYLRLFSSCHRVESPQLSEQVKASLLERDWPGNLRELQDYAERLVVESAHWRHGLLGRAEAPSSTASQR